MSTSRIGRVAPGMLAALCLIPAVAGCQTRGIGSQGLGGGVTTATLTDASFGGMQAAEVAVPAGWKVQGQMLQSPCTNIASASWDAVSPDGQSELHVLPLFGWRWGNTPQGVNGCIPLKQPLQAADFLQAFTRKLPGGVRLLGTMPVADGFRRREENLTNVSNNARLRIRATGDVAALRAVDASGHEMRLRAFTVCRMHSQGGDCMGRIEMLRTPNGRLNALVTLVDNHNMLQEQPTQQWIAAYQNRQQQIGQQQMGQLAHNAAVGNAMLRKQYEDSSARLNAEHQAGIEELQNSTNSSMNNAMNNMNARSTSASDMEDYSLNQQTVSGANGTYKTSSQYSSVWSSPVGPALSDGRTFGSSDNTIDPNTATDNTWTKDTKVHGNGQPY